MPEEQKATWPLYPCPRVNCKYRRNWYLSGMEFFQKAFDEPGVPSTTDFCFRCLHFIGFDLYEEEGD